MRPGAGTVEPTRRTFEATARPAARVQDGKRKRAVAPGHSSRRRPRHNTPGTRHPTQTGPDHAARATTAAALDEEQEPEPDQPGGMAAGPEAPWEAAVRSGEGAGPRRLAAGQSRRPRSRQNRIGAAAAHRDARAVSRLRHSIAWLW
jgi:hypothetical protein